MLKAILDLPLHLNKENYTKKLISIRELLTTYNEIKEKFLCSFHFFIVVFAHLIQLKKTIVEVEQIKSLN